MARMVDEVASQLGMTTMEIADVLDKAADEMMIRGNIKASMINQQGMVCLLGALGLALGMTDEEIQGAGMTKIDASEAAGMLRTYITSAGITVQYGKTRRRIDHPNSKFVGQLVNFTERDVPSIWAYNDHCDTKPGEAEALLRHAAKWLRETDGKEDTPQ